AGLLQGDSAVGGIQTSLRALLGATSGASSAFGRLSDVGLEAQRDGTLTVNDTKLTSALQDLPQLKKAFSNSDGTNPSNNGFARNYAALATRVLGVDGTVTTRTDGLQKLITKVGKDQERLNDRVDLFQKRLVAQYTALDANVSRLNGLSSYVTQQLNLMNRSRN
ncbi:MAG: flagellar filament capping protein FliD, partial [Rubrivivax sp.]